MKAAAVPSDSAGASEGAAVQAHATEGGDLGLAPLTERQIDHVVHALENRIRSELDRRGGRYTGVF
jgi:hypothetical protein